MYREMRRKKNQLPDEKAYELLNIAQWGVLSLCDGNGLPYGVPLSHALVGNTLVFHCAMEGQKLDFIGENINGCYTAVASAEVLRSHGSIKYESVMAFGPMRIVHDPAQRLAGFDAINAKYTETYELGRSFVEKWGANAALIAMDIERITAKGNKED